MIPLPLFILFTSAKKILLPPLLLLKRGQKGVCGPSCNNLRGVDIGGVLEIDTNTDTIITQHLIIDDKTTGDPYVSPDGRWVAMITTENVNNSDIRILKTGSNGENSKVSLAFSIPYNRIDDLVYIQSEPNNLIDGIHRDYLLLSIHYIDKIILVDLANIDPTTNQPKLFYIEPKRGLDQMKRTMEWVEGTPYVWFNGFNEAYVLNVDEKKITNTLLGIDVSAMLTVRNQEREMATMIAMEKLALAMANINAINPVSASDDMTVTKEDDDLNEEDDDNIDDYNFDDDDAYEEKQAFDDDDWFDDDNEDDNDYDDADVTFINEDGTFDNKDNSLDSTSQNAKTGGSVNIDPISISALVIGIIAISIGIVNLLYFNNLKKKFQMTPMNPLTNKFVVV